ncbi:hypothetical protein PoB_000633500 [Plakobranchus ocellatus]|uniref:Uncharacterized protein n=1 Tax=Plakobranchus ocellatus TaxID=259542 RepID=A0AAV3YAM1_9GAST|nr:hypothetical protein PoB_000633500 [Plakobranchus ocellatus]
MDYTDMYVCFGDPLVDLCAEVLSHFFPFDILLFETGDMDTKLQTDDDRAKQTDDNHTNHTDDDNTELQNDDYSTNQTDDHHKMLQNDDHYKIRLMTTI